MANSTYNSYDAGKYGVVTRTWFGLTDKWGGGFTSAYTKGSATCVNKLAKCYMKGPITIKKFGIMVLATLGTPATAPNDGFYYRLYKNTTVVATDIIYAHTAARSPSLGGIASKEFTGVKGIDIDAGTYIKIKTSTPYTADGTVEAGTITGSFAFFIDWVPKFEQGKWDL
jgi:hypothetical protein